MQQRITWSVADVPGCFTSKVFADRNELHFRSDNPATRILELGNTGAWLSSQHGTTHQWKVFQLADVLHTRAIGRVEREITVIYRLRFTTFILFDVAAANNPFPPQLR